MAGNDRRSWPAFTEGSVAVLLLTCSFDPAAQAVSNAQVHGVVVDSSKAVIPGVVVKATQTLLRS